MKRSIILTTAVLLAAASVLATGVQLSVPSYAHEGETHFSAGEPGDPKKPARVMLITMREGDGKMMFSPDQVEVRKGEQIRFILQNNGALDHEFLLATTEENLKHGELMKKYPDMEHDDPNGKRLKSKEHKEIVWRFTKAGEFEFACLIPGHRESGMHGKIIVK